MEIMISCDGPAPLCEWNNHSYKLNSRLVDGTPWQMGMLDPLIKTSNENITTGIESDLTASSSKKLQI
jgi:hypothetical protein